MNANQCPVCDRQLETGLFVWHLKCPGCEYEGSTLEPAINSTPAHELIDESNREQGLKTLRVQNFQTLLTRIQAFKKRGCLLEVGSAHGWFLELARPDFEVTGIEPDHRILNDLGDKTLSVRCGFFPQALNEHETFDVIVFNDVIEHIENIRFILDMCHRHLNEQGVLVLNLPNSKGFFYSLAKTMAKRSIHGPFDRLWQKGFPSPHVHYFHPANLDALLDQQGFSTREFGRLPTLVTKGLYARISLDKGLGSLTKSMLYIAVLLSLPVIRLLPGDIFYIIAERRSR